MKVRLLTLAVAALAGQAHALNVADTNAATQIYVAGASASNTVLAGLFAQNCAAGTLNTYLSKAGSAVADPLDTKDGQSFKTYSCTLIASNDWGLPAGTNVALHKRDRLGSVYGVQPVAKNLSIQFMAINANCSAPNAAQVSTCTDSAYHAPDGGISDEEPAIFQAAVNKPTTINTEAGDVSTPAFALSDFAAAPTPLFQTGFGLFVSNALYNALQAAQGTTGTPNFPYTVASSMLRSGFLSTIGWKALNVVNATNQVNICRRDIGSGTQAASNIYFLQNPSNGAVNILPLTASNSSPGVTLGNTPGKLYVREANSTGQVKDCLTQANGLGAYAMGVMSLENVDAADYKRVNIDGANGTRDGFKSAQSSFFMESTLQINKNAGAAQKTFLTAFAQQAGLPDNLDQAGAANVGYASLPTQPAVGAKLGCAGLAFGTGTPAQMTFCSRVRKGGNSLDIARLAK